MGLDINGTKFLLYAQKHGVSFEATAMLGRQSMLIDAETLRRNLDLFYLKSSLNEVKAVLGEGEGYAEPFLRLLGAKSITSFDASDYEDASVVHDLNTPIPDPFRNRFSMVLDGGTLEHVFNFPTAIRNCMEMVRVGGHFLAIAPSNNYFGHGFYQFSPELFYRVLSAENGFKVEKLLIYEETFENDWYEVADPAHVNERVVLTNNEPTLLLVMARKTAETPTTLAPIQQSDYQQAWKSDSAAAEHGRSLSLFEKVWRRIQHRVGRSIGTLATNKKHFKKVELP